MIKQIASFAAAIAFMIPANGALAQSQTNQEEVAGQEGETDQENVAGMTMGTDATVPQDLGKPYIRETNGDWKLQCLRTETPETDPCQMYQLLSTEDGSPIAEVFLFRLPEGGQAKAGAEVIVPLETSLQQQLTISIDGGPVRRYPYAFCSKIGCVARIGFTEGDVAALKRGIAAEMKIVPFLAQNSPIALSLSLKGFTASYDNTSILQK